MIPYLVIGIAALIGLLGWGMEGLIFGAIGGFIFSPIFGSLLTLCSGGLLPRKVRKQTAARFMALYPDLVQRAFPNTPETERQELVEGFIEGIFKRSVIDSKSMHMEAGWNRNAIQDATAKLIAEEQHPDMKTFLASLEQYIEQEMYP